jgi:hypothetical protein
MNGTASRILTAVFSLATMAALAGCAPFVVRTGSSPAPVVSTEPVVDNVPAAEQSALALFAKIPLNASDASAGYMWTSGPWSASHITPAVNARLSELGASRYFSDGGGCGEDYITGTQNGLFTQPKVKSAVAGADGKVTVVIERGSPRPPTLTAVMTKQNGSWLAADLASGSGPAASIFSAKPNC